MCVCVKIGKIEYFILMCTYFGRCCFEVCCAVYDCGGG